jgi:hypothetical protein
MARTKGTTKGTGKRNTTRTQTGLESIIRDVIAATRGTYGPYWTLARYVVVEMTGKVAERAETVSTAYQRVNDGTPARRGEGVSLSTAKHLIGAWRTWGEIMTPERQARMHPLTAYAWRNEAYQTTDGKRTKLVGKALEAAYDAIVGTPSRKGADGDGLVSIRIPADLRDRLAALAEAAQVDIATVIVSALDTVE